jgi:predicted acetylornithine/succinylornithine family transaminase
MKKKDYDSLFAPVYKREGAPLTEGKDVYLYDADGNKYLDFGTGIAVNALGHAHPALIKTLREQGKMLLHSSNLYFSQTQIDLARLLLKKSFGDRVFFCNSGTEANEAAIKFARKWAKKISADKYHVLSFTGGFHGRTYGALSATAQEKFHAGFEPILEGFHYAAFNDIENTKKLLEQNSFAAVIVEPIQGEGGIFPATKEFLQFLREYTQQNSIALIFDEIQCGMGRAGTLWAYEQYKVIPDMMTLAKPVGGGLPLGVVICKEDIALALSPGDHGTTFGGNPVSCALGSTVLEIISQKPFLKEVRFKGEYLKKKLNELKKKLDIIQEIRGCGLIIGIQLSEDPQPFISKCKQQGLLVVKAAQNTIRMLPPLIVKTKEIDKAVSILENVLSSGY